MLQTTFRTDSRKAGEGIVVPQGIVRLVRTGFDRYRLRELLDGFKEAGVPLGLVIENLCISCLDENYSMNDWDQYVNRNPVRKEFFCGSYEIKRWTFQRGIELLGTHLEEVVDHLAKVTRTLYPDEQTHVYVDGSYIERHGSKGAGVLYGEGGGKIQLQNQFMYASMMQNGLPVAIESYPGNLNDPPQYTDFIPQLQFLLNTGSLVVMDNGGAAASILDEITDRENQYLTRVRINASDIRTIETSKDRLVYVGLNTACITHTYASSQRTTYLYFSIDSYTATAARAEKALAAKEEERKRAQKVIEKGDAIGIVTVPRSPFYKVVVNDATIVMTLDPWLELDPEKEYLDAIPTKGGWFKLECSFPMDPRLALVVYRHRVQVEYSISVLKSIVNLDPLRVWGADSIRGKLALAFITQFLVSALIRDLEPDRVERVVDGKTMEVETRPSAKAVVKELRRYHATVVAYPWGGFNVTDILDVGLMERLSEVLDRQRSEGPVHIPDGLQWRFDPPAQWGRKRKNCNDLAMSIAQFIADAIFPEFMSGRCHWKDIDPELLGDFEPSIGIDPGSIGARGLEKEEITASRIGFAGRNTGKCAMRGRPRKQ